MKMNKFFMSLCAAAAIFGFASCSEDDLKGGTDDNKVVNTSGDGMFISVNVQMPKGDTGRSQTVTPGQSNDGNEVGTAEENKVGSVLIVLATTKNEYIAAGLVQTGSTLVPNEVANSYKATAKITKTALGAYYNSEFKTNNLINLYVFCNPTTDLQSTFFKKGSDGTDGEALTTGNTDWVNTICKVSVTKEQTASIWADNSFLMNNAEIATREIPSTIDAWDFYKTEATAFDFSGNNGSINGDIDNSANYTDANNVARGNVRVERAVARFDFKDGSELGDNTYEVYKRSTVNADGETIVHPLVNVQLNRMVLVNMCNQFYYLPRVSPTGSNNNAVLCGAETPVNYVVGPYATYYAGNVTRTAWNNANGFGMFMNFPFFNVKDQTTGEFTYNFNSWDATYRISTVLGNHADNLNQEYKVWRYVTENVIPDPETNQTNGITTAVVFKGKMLPTEHLLEETDPFDKKLYDALEGKTLKIDESDPILYSYNSVLYCDWEAVRHAALIASVTFADAENTTPKFEDVTNDAGEVIGKRLVVNRADPFYQAVYGSGCIGKFTWAGKEYEDAPYQYEEGGLNIDENAPNTKWIYWDANRTNNTLYNDMANTMTKNGFTIYQSSNDTEMGNGYYCHYFYWNRHNDNNQPGEMGTMEFAVVRNNVYKLAVTSISKLGHPRLPINDPDSPTPDTPDESDDLYFTVNCQVLPWVVRVNNIVF